MKYVMLFLLLGLLSFSCSNKYEVKIEYDDYHKEKEVFKSENDSTAYLAALEIYYIREEAANRTHDMLSKKLEEEGKPVIPLDDLISYPTSFIVTSLSSYKTIDRNDFNFNDADIEIISQKFKKLKSK